MPSPKAVVEALAAQGIQTSRNFVCVVREKMARELQVRASEARLIPYVPADRDSQ